MATPPPLPPSAAFGDLQRYALDTTDPLGALYAPPPPPPPSAPQPRTPGAAYARYAAFRFLGMALWSPVEVGTTLLHITVVPNRRTRRRMACLGSGDEFDSAADNSGEDTGDPTMTDEDEADDDAYARAALEAALGLTPRAAPAMSGSPPPIDPDGYVAIQARPPSPPPTTMWGHIRAVRAQHGIGALFRGLGAGYLREMVAETLAPGIHATVCEALNIDDTLLPVDHDNPVPICATALATWCAVDVALAPLDVARTRLIAGTERHGLVQALRTQFHDGRSTWTTRTLVVPTLCVSAVAHAAELVVPVLIDRVLGVSEVYNPVQYAVCELVLACARDAILVPLQTVRHRMYAQPARVPYTGVRDCLRRMVREEGGGTHRRRHSKKTSGLKYQVAQLEPLYHGFATRVATNLAYFAMRIVSEYVELVELDEDEF